MVARMLKFYMLCVIVVACEGFAPPSDRELRSAVRVWQRDQAKALEQYGRMEAWDTSLVTNMSFVFADLASFNENIGGWNTHLVTSMKGLFSDALTFNQHVGGWNIARVTDISESFAGAETFNQNIGEWSTARVVEISEMFFSAFVFNQNIGKWNIAEVRSLQQVFYTSEGFNHDIDGWNTHRVTSTLSSFAKTQAFDQDVGTWNTDRIKDMTGMFRKAVAFNRNIGEWHTGEVTGMTRLFFSETTSKFDQAIGTWNTARVADVDEMFYGAKAFNRYIGTWNTAEVTTMHAMFDGAIAFDQNIGSWNTHLVRSTRQMFLQATAFNQDVGKWDTTRLETTKVMFGYAKVFNQNIDKWNVKNLLNAENIFYKALVFNGDVGKWNTARVRCMRGMFKGASSFNTNIGSWNTGDVNNMSTMFQYAATFNQDIGNWHTGKVVLMQLLFAEASSFRQDLTRWDTSSATNMVNIFFKSGVSLCPHCSYSWFYWLIDVLAFVLVILWCGTHTNGFTVPWRRTPRLETCVSWPKIDQDQKDALKRGRELHHQIGPEMWGVTREDLAVFEEEVRIAWKNGVITNNADHPNEFHDDPSVGPTMYQVNTDFIKPITKDYGGMSYALMLHPHGLECDCFATHSWKEGVFEFCSKVRRGWPKHCQHMYICFLSNPQCLDISDLLNVAIEESPFAKALSKASTMLVVPNRFESIYARLWCCYEAYKAYRLKKTIVLPPARIFVKWVLFRCALVVLTIIVFTGVGFALGNNRSDGPTFRQIKEDARSCEVDKNKGTPWEICKNKLIWPLSILAPPLSLVMLCMLRNPYKARCVAAFIQVATSAAIGIFISVGWNLLDVSLVACSTDYEWQVTGQVYAGTTLILICMMIAHIFRCRAEEARLQESSELKFDSLGSAICTSQDDEIKIREAIRGQETEVESALQTLMLQGMSTEELRRGPSQSKRGIGYKDLGMAMFTLFLWPVYVCVVGFQLGFTHMWKKGSIRDRIYFTNIFVGTLFFCICLWVHLQCDADLANLVMRAAFSGWFCALFCSLFSGSAGIVGGIIYASTFIVIFSRYVQQSQLRILLDVLHPVTALCWVLFAWEIFSMVAFDTHCICIGFQLAGIWASLLLGIVVARISGCQWASFELEWKNTFSTAGSEQIPMPSAGSGIAHPAKKIGARFVPSICALGLLVATHHFLLTRHKWFLAEASHLEQSVGVYFCFVWSGSTLLVLSLGSLILMWKKRERHCRDQHALATREHNIEMRIRKQHSGTSFYW